MLAVKTYPQAYIDDCRTQLAELLSAYHAVVDGRDGNPLNEVRMLSSSILRNQRVLAADTSIKYSPTTSVLHLAIGDSIALDADFAEIERKFT